MNRITKLVSWVLLSVGVASCSNDSNSVTVETVESSHTVTVSGIELENVDNGQPVLVLGNELISGQVLIED